MHILLPEQYLERGTKTNHVIQHPSGVLLSSSYASWTIARSTDLGQTWTDTFTATSDGQGRLLFVDPDTGFIYAGNHKAGAQGYVVRSTDVGLTWGTVLTVDATSTWYMAKDPITGYLYINEYSTGNQDANELYAYHVWRSTTGGGSGSWSKWLSYPAQSTPGAKDGIRHIHCFFIDSAGRKYVTAGDIAGGFAGSGRMHKVNDNGTFGTDLGEFGNGPISMCEADDGGILLGTDLAVSGSHPIWKYDPSDDSVDVAVTLATAFAAPYSSFVYSICKGKDGVLYGRINDEGTAKRGALVVSADDGATWHLIDIQGYWGSGIWVTCNRQVENSRVYVSRAENNYISIPDFTRDELNSFVSGNRIRRAVGWDR